MPAVLNISAYLFTPLPDAGALQPILLERAQALELKGTILPVSYTHLTLPTNREV